MCGKETHIENYMHCRNKYDICPDCISAKEDECKHPEFDFSGRLRNQPKEQLALGRCILCKRDVEVRVILTERDD